MFKVKKQQNKNKKQEWPFPCLSKSNTCISAWHKKQWHHQKKKVLAFLAVCIPVTHTELWNKGNMLLQYLNVTSLMKSHAVILFANRRYTEQQLANPTDFLTCSCGTYKLG